MRRWGRLVRFGGKNKSHYKNADDFPNASNKLKCGVHIIIYIKDTNYRGNYHNNDFQQISVFALFGKKKAIMRKQCWYVKAKQN